MLYFILGASIVLNIFTIFIIIYGYKYIKKNLFVPKIEDNNTKDLNLKKMIQMIDDFYNE